WNTAKPTSATAHTYRMMRRSACMSTGHSPFSRRAWPARLRLEVVVLEVGLEVVHGVDEAVDRHPVRVRQRSGSSRDGVVRGGLVRQQGQADQVVESGRAGRDHRAQVSQRGL